MNNAENELDLLKDIRELLMLIAEPQLAQRDRSRREQLRKIAGKGEKNMKAVLLMDGSRNQAAISKEVPIDVGQLSTLVKNLREAKLLHDSPNPHLVIPVNESVFKEALSHE